MVNYPTIRTDKSIEELTVYSLIGIEYWQHADPACPSSIVQCSDDGEDPACSGSIPSQGVNAAHMKYFGILAGTPFCL